MSDAPSDRLNNLVDLPSAVNGVIYLQANIAVDQDQYEEIQKSFDQIVHLADGMDGVALTVQEILDSEFGSLAEDIIPVFTTIKCLETLVYILENLENWKLLGITITDEGMKLINELKGQFIQRHLDLGILISNCRLKVSEAFEGMAKRADRIKMPLAALDPQPET